MDGIFVIKSGQWETLKPEFCSFSNISVVDLKAGGSVPCHRHDCDEYLVITAGRAELLLDDQKFVAGSGDIVAIPFGTRHQIESISDDLTMISLLDELRGARRKGSLPVSAGESREFISEEGRYETGHVRLNEMPRINSAILPPRTWFWLNQKPAWSRYTNISMIYYKPGDFEKDYHFHENLEYYILAEGQITAYVDGEKYIMHKGDIVVISLGTNHQVLEVPVASTLVYVYDELYGLKRYGHLQDGRDERVI